MAQADAIPRNCPCSRLGKCRPFSPSLLSVPISFYPPHTVSLMQDIQDLDGDDMPVVVDAADLPPELLAALSLSYPEAALDPEAKIEAGTEDTK
jgi:hypothetical protein